MLQRHSELTITSESFHLLIYHPLIARWKTGNNRLVKINVFWNYRISSGVETVTTAKVDAQFTSVNTHSLLRIVDILERLKEREGRRLKISK